MRFYISKLGLTGILSVLVGCSGEPVFEASSTSQFRHTQEIVESVALSNDGQLSVVSEQGKVCVWDNTIKKTLFNCITGDDAKHVELVGVSDDKTKFYISNRMSVHLFSVKTGQLLGSWSTGQNIARDIALSANGQLMVVAYRSGEADVINTNTKQNTLFQIHRLDINSVALSADGQTAFTGSSDKFAYLWATDDGAILQKFKLATRVNHVSMNENATLGFAIDSVDDRVFVDLKTGTEQAQLNIFANFIEFNHSRFINNNKWFLTGSPNSTLQLWRVQDGTLLAEYKAAQQRIRGSVLAVAYDKENKNMVSENSDGVREVWPYQPK
ncbi:WD40 repeat domain-containing protein [Pseudoalteromonas sp. ASV78]|uniref:WD40 repeat domain-containing protein n=1 Tax=Pseudoalteromonas sp. ASV78 TaxID=3397851 RepID=UPI0039FB9A18